MSNTVWTPEAGWHDGPEVSNLEVAARLTRPAPRCTCAVNNDGSVTTMLCAAHADRDPCLTMSLVTGRRRKGTIRRGRCTACGHGAK